MTIPRIILDLINRFEANKDSYFSVAYNETQLRREFVDPLFKELGWDVANEQGYAEAYKDVIHEDSIKIGSATKAPDYCFRIGGARKYFVETKKPSVNIKEDNAPSFQLRRYAWSAKLPLSILTDFEEFAVYDCREKPDKEDKSPKGRILYLTYKEYEQKWEEISAIFSKDSVLKGSFDRYAESSKGKKGTSEVDNAFLEEIERWREILAKNIALRNPSLTQRELNFSVQRTIDRIIFLRICEDRGIEHYGSLMALLNGEHVYERMRHMFYRADEIYNSGLFHFRNEKEREEQPDTLTLTLQIEDKPLKDIIKNLYYPESPYEFSVLPSDILGQVYEKFLGKVIRLTKEHRAVVDDKPEVKKAGGIFYTPTYIVDYIVKNTVGKIIEVKTPKQVEEIKILDPACGSGSFLIQAYQYLLDWHRDWYINDGAEKHSKSKDPKLTQVRSGEWRLSTPERKKILLNNIFGVDIDSQAVEVTKLSLLLKVLEGENEQSLNVQMKLFHERALPDLERNIKCGNSLIGTDYYEGVQESMGLYEDEDEERIKINAFDWDGKYGFPGIMKMGGFDVVIGNPPYIPIESMTEEQKRYYQTHFPQLERKYDSSVIFILSLLTKLKPSGLLGYISSLTWQTGENFTLLRECIFKNYGIVSLINLPFDVFKDAYVDTGIYIFSKKPTKSYAIYRYPKKTAINSLSKVPFLKIPCKLIKAPDFKVILDPISASILKKISEKSNVIALGEISTSTQGYAGNMFNLSHKQLKSSYPFLEVGQVYRYLLHTDKISYTDMSDKLSLCPFYEAVPKLLIRRVISRQDRLLCTFTKERLVFKKDINPFILNNANIEQTLFLLGILNSKLISFLYINSSSIATKDDFRQTTLSELRKIPIVKIEDPKNTYRTNIIFLVSSMLNLKQKLLSVKTDHEKTVLSRQIEATDRKIDQMVYELYDLTPEEISIIESTKLK